MANKNVNPNAKKALEEMKLEIANEIGVETIINMAQITLLMKMVN